MFIALLAIAAFYLAVVVLLYTRQEAILFVRGGEYQPPSVFGLDGVASEVEITTSDNERLLGWFHKAEPGLPTLLFFHGNAGVISDRPKRFEAYAQAGLGVLFVEFRGYGKSTGSPSEAGFMRDAEAAHAWLLQQSVAAKDIVFVGESLGTAVAVKLAAEKQGAALLLQAPYSAVVDVAADHYWYVPVRLLLRHHFDAASVIARARMPLLIQHGSDDQTIPIRYARKLFAAAGEPKEFVEIPGGTHMIFNLETYAREIDFLVSHGLAQL